MDNDVKDDKTSLTHFQENVERWQLAETIQDHIDKLNALVLGMTGEDFYQIQARSRACYLCILLDYIQAIDSDFKQFCELWEVWQKEQ